MPYIESDDTLSVGEKAAKQRYGTRKRTDLATQADVLREYAIALDQHVDELAAYRISKFEMDGHGQFARGAELVRRYLVQVNRAIGNGRGDGDIFDPYTEDVSRDRTSYRKRSELEHQANTLREYAIVIDEFVRQLADTSVSQFEMDGFMQFARGAELIRMYLIQVNRWIGKAEYS